MQVLTHHQILVLAILFKLTRSCRNRRVKCDEEKPVCRRCQAAGVACQGRAYGRSSANFITPTTSLYQVWAIPSAAAAPQLYSSAQMNDLIHLVPYITSLVQYDCLKNPANMRNDHLTLNCANLAMYVEFLPSRLGYSSSLDSAIQCVVGALRDLTLPLEQRTPVTTLVSYTKALKHLQRSIADAEQCQKSETLCATQLLGIFEVKGYKSIGRMRLLVLLHANASC